MVGAAVPKCWVGLRLGLAHMMTLTSEGKKALLILCPLAIDVTFFNKTVPNAHEAQCYWCKATIIYQNSFDTLKWFKYKPCAIFFFI